MSLSAYQVFVAIADSGSLAAAAHRLNLTASAISHALAAFEEELGFTLLVRNRGGIRLTAGGEALLPSAREVLQCDDKFRQKASKVLGLESGTVRIGAFVSVSAAWIPQIIRSFADLYPNIEITFEQGMSHEVAEWVLKSRVDLGLIIMPAAPGLDVVPLYEDPILCIAPHGFSPRNHAFITVREFAEHNIVLQGKETERVLAGHKIAVRSSARALEAEPVIAMVASGLGISVMPQLSLKSFRSAVQAFPFNPPISRSIGLASLDPGGLAPAAKAMQQHIIDAVTRYKETQDRDESPRGRRRRAAFASKRQKK